MTVFPAEVTVEQSDYIVFLLTSVFCRQTKRVGTCRVGSLLHF